MENATLWPWIVLAGLGAMHGINPGMGWLFAVALGLQEGKGRAVWRALPPLALGHALAIVLAVGLAMAVGGLVPLTPLRWTVAGILLAFGIYRLVRHAHPRYGGMRVGARQLTVWSFLMATAHGAGLMILPVVLAGPHPIASDWTADLTHDVASAGVPVEHGAALGMDGVPGAHTHPAQHTELEASGAGRAGHAGHHALLAGLPAGVLAALAVALVHTVGYLAVAAGLAWLVYARLGVRILRTAWLNVDLVWGVALVATALVTPFV